jgi:hypothetical protein
MPHLSAADADADDDASGASALLLPSTTDADNDSDAATPPPPPPPSAYPLSRRRFVVLLLLSLSSALSAFQWIYLAPVQPTVTSLFSASPLLVNLISILFFALYLPASVLGIFLMETRGLTACLLWGAGLNAACAALKMAAGYLPAPLLPTYGFGLLVFGQVLGAIGQPLIVNPVPRLSADWYSAEGRDMATVVATQMNILGQLAGNVLPPLLVSDAASLARLGLVQTLLCGAVLVLTAVFVRDRPAHPPSEAARVQWAARREALGRAAEGKAAKKAAAEAAARGERAQEAPQQHHLDAGAARGEGAQQAPQRHHHLDAGDGDYKNSSSSNNTVGGGADAGESMRAMWADTSALFRNRDFNLLNLGFSSATGVGWTLLTVEAQLLSPCGYSDAVAGDSGAALLALGVVAAVAAAPVMSRTRAYCLLQKLVLGFCLAATVLVLLVNRPGNAPLVVGAWLLLGAGLQPLLPLTLEHAAEMTFPVPADVSSAVLQTCANVAAMGQTFALTPLLVSGAAADCSSVVNPASGFVLGFMVLGLAATLPVRKVLKRGPG